MGSSPRLSGAVFTANLKLYRELLGSDVVDATLATLPADQREEVDAAVASAWLRASTCDAVYTALGAETGRDPIVVYRDIVERGVERTLITLWRVLLQVTTDRALLSRTPQFYRKGHDTGELSAAMLGPGFARLVLTGWPDIPEMRLHGVAAGVTAVLRVAGRRSVSLTFERTADGARFDARWKV